MISCGLSAAHCLLQVRKDLCRQQLCEVVRQIRPWPCSSQHLSKNQTQVCFVSIHKTFCGENILFVSANLPMPPTLPPDLAHLPYIRHKPGRYSTASSAELIAAHKFHQRQEAVGDSVAKVFVVHWLINHHVDLEAQVAHVSCDSRLLPEDLAEYRTLATVGIYRYFPMHC